MEFNYKEMDPEGWETLKVISEADKLNQWMFHTIHPFLKGKVLEIGSGIGNISAFVLKNNYHLTLSDIRPSYREVLKQQFGSHPNADEVIELDIVDPAFDQKFSKYFNTFDAIFALNVVEHIKDDKLAIANCKKLLAPGGRLTILVPAYQSLYNHFDEALEHYRRYNKTSLSALFTAAGLQITRKRYFNSAGIMGWFVSGKLQKNKIIPGGQMKLYNTLVPVFRLMDKILLNRIGLSVIVSGTKD